MNNAVAMLEEQLAQTRGEPEVTTSDFDRWTLASLEAHEPNPADYVAGDGWLRLGACTTLAGYTGQGKSILALQIAISVAAGLPILGRIRVARARRVLVIQAENDADTLKRDFLSIFEHLEADRNKVQDNVVIDHVYGLTGETLASYLQQRINEYRPDLVVIDPYQSFVGETDINSSASFLGWQQWIEPALKEHGIALLLVVHFPKPSEVHKKWHPGHSVYMMSGSATISNWARCSAELYPLVKHNDRYTLRFGKNPERTGLIDEESKNPIRDLCLEQSPDKSCPYWKVADDQSSADTESKSDMVRRVKEEHPDWTQQKIADEVGCGKSTVCEALKNS